MDVAANSADRETKSAGDLGVRERLDVAEDYSGSMPDRKAIQGSLHVASQATRIENVSGIWFAPDESVSTVAGERTLGAPHALTAGVDEEIGGNST